MKSFGPSPSGLQAREKHNSRVKEEVASVVNWDNSMQFYFVTAPVRNPVIQAHLAVTTFRLRAQKWWQAQVQARPELVITYDQLREWIKTELVPKADPRSTSAAWRQLRFTGNVQEYIDQLEALKEHFPLMKDPLLDLSTAPLGEEARAVNLSSRCHVWGFGHHSQ